MYAHNMHTKMIKFVGYENCPFQWKNLDLGESLHPLLSKESVFQLGDKLSAPDVLAPACCKFTIPSAALLVPALVLRARDSGFRAQFWLQFPKDLVWFLACALLAGCPTRLGRSSTLKANESTRCSSYSHRWELGCPGLLSCFAS